MEDRLHHLLHAQSEDEARRRLSELHPTDLADLAQQFDPADRLRLWERLEDEHLARVVEELDPPAQLEVLNELPKSRIRRVLPNMAPDDLADLLGGADISTVRAVLDLIPGEAAEIRRLLAYPEASAGGLMTTDFIALDGKYTAKEALTIYRRVAPEVEAAYYVYVTNGHGRLAGAVSLRELVLASPGSSLMDIVTTDLLAVDPHTDQEEVAELLSRYDLVAVPVVDGAQQLIGVVTVDDVIDVIEEETTEDISRIGGSEPLQVPYLSSSVGLLIQKRVGWLIALFAAQWITGTILAHYQDALGSVIALAFFIPMLIGTGGNAGAQAATLVVRAMATGDVSPREFLQVVWREARIGLTLGAVVSLLAFARAFLLDSSPLLGYTVAITTLLVILMASVVGAALPLTVAKLKIDPAVAATPVVTTIVDGGGLLIYFTVAKLLLRL